MNVSERIASLRELMAKAELDAYLVPSTDPHQSEYVAKAWQRRPFISGFDGSAGTVVVTSKAAGLWTDSRYFIQAEQQLEGSGIELFRQGEQGVPEIEPWLAATLPMGARVGLDSAVFSAYGFGRIEKELSDAGIQLEPVEHDLVEQVWGAERPPMPDQALRAHPLQYAGETCADKLSRLRQALSDTSADAMVLAALDEIAWLFNLRGQDVAFNPVFIAFAVVDAKRASLFVDPDKLSDQVRESLPDDVIILPYESFDSALSEMGDKGWDVWIDGNTINQGVVSSLKAAGADLIRQGSPLPAWKAAKNEAEIAGMRAAHQRDGLAMVQFLRWLEENLAGGELTELGISRKLQSFRKDLSGYVGDSFSTIAGYGPHGAIVHYRVTEESDAALSPDGLLLVDSGGQYEDGTTDITRTLALGEPSSEQIMAYTAVLLGHLRLSRCRFPSGTDGYQLDVLARAPLWSSGLNYGHGTGHGVGAALCVHEGPFSVSTRKVLVPLEPGNILSIEPGFYQADGYGIRIENLALVVEAENNDFGRFFAFETLTLCPYDRRLIDIDRLTAADIDQIDQYHTRVFETLSPDLSPADKDWLQTATRPL